MDNKVTQKKHITRKEHKQTQSAGIQYNCSGAAMN